MKISGKSGLAVELTDEEFGERLAKSGGDFARARADVLNTAGRVLKHRGNVQSILAQKLTDEQRQQIESIAAAEARAHVLFNAVCDLGYETYAIRAQQGGIMPAAWDRILDRASESIRREKIEVTDNYREIALGILGLWTAGDLEWSRRVAGWCKWKITAPLGWAAGDPITNGEQRGNV